MGRSGSSRRGAAAVGRPPPGFMSRRQFIAAAGAGGALLLAPRLTPRAFGGRRTRRPRDTVAMRWNEAFLQAVRESKLGPPMVARALAIGHTCIYDAWAAYDARAVGTRLGGELRRPAAERALTNRTRAISFAAYRAGVDLFPGSTTSAFDPLMHELRYDPGDLSTDTTTATGIGNVAAQAVLDFRHRDGANQLADEAGGLPGVPYSDYTAYAPVNDPLDIRVRFDPATVHNPSSWQPLRYVDETGAVVTQSFVGAQWLQVRPFALRSHSQLRSPTGPAAYGSGEYRDQALALLDISAHLTDEHKAIAEYWGDGPGSELPPGHWNLFAQFVSRRDHHDASHRRIDADVRMLFALTNAIFDAGICAWDNKRAFDSVRPITAIRRLFAGQSVRAWGGPYQGTVMIDGGTWFPYQPRTFPTPPFPEYSSGHSTFSAAGAEILKIFTGSDRFGWSTTVPAGSSRIEPGTAPAADLELSWGTFSEAADAAGMSRRYGGIHFEQGDLDARAAGRAVARRAWRKAREYWEAS